MAHRSSAAALTAARVVLKNYRLDPRPPESLPSGAVKSLTASEAHVSTVIDYATNVYLIAELRPELSYWQERMTQRTADAPKLTAFLNRIVEEYSKLPSARMQDTLVTVTLQVPLEFGGGSQDHVLSKPSIEASRFLFHYYDVSPLSGERDDETDRAKVAMLVEGSIGLSRTAQVPKLASYFRDGLKSGTATEGEVRRCLRRIGILLEHLPNYQERREEAMLLS